MTRLTFIFLLLSSSLFGQGTRVMTKEDLTKIYKKAIGDFIKAANQRNKKPFDTLFFGKRVNGQPDDFPDIKLPVKIEKTQIRLITPEAGEKKQKEKRSRVYINLVGWVDKDKASFIFVVFSNGFAHQYDCYINYKYNTSQNEFVKEDLQFKGPPFN
jgi:hypothetical protein